MMAGQIEETDVGIAAWARLMRVSRQMLDGVEGDLKTAGLPPLAWYDALLELRRAGKSGLRPFALQEKMLLAQYNISRLTNRLAAAGYVARRSCPEDGRGHNLVITGKGRDLVKRMWPVYRKAINRHFADKVTAEDADGLLRILGRFQPTRQDAPDGGA